jgi:hypothetical protein
MLAKINLQILGLVGVVIVGILAVYGNYIYDKYYGDPLAQMSIAPAPSTEGGVTLTPMASSSAISSTPNPSDVAPTKTNPPAGQVSPSVTASPTKKVSPTPATPTVTDQPTPTAIPQSVQVTARFMQWAICNESDMGQVNGVINQASTQLEDYDECKAAVDTQTQECFAQCSTFNTSCQEACGRQADTAYANCKSSYCDGVVNGAISNLGNYCDQVEPHQCEACKCKKSNETCDC